MITHDGNGMSTPRDSVFVDMGMDKLALEENESRPALQLARAYTRELKRHFGDNLVSVVVYGSAARKMNTALSDIDLLIVAGELPSSLRERNRLFANIEERLLASLEMVDDQRAYVDFSTIARTPQEAERFIPLYLDLTEDALILHDKSGFFQEILERLKTRLRELGARRLRRGNVLYWHLKPDYDWGEIFEI